MNVLIEVNGIIVFDDGTESRDYRVPFDLANSERVQFKSICKRKHKL